ncbi:MAG: ABC transporter ATP-binding protein [Ilumatobacteraceae bacterium]
MKGLLAQSMRGVSLDVLREARRTFPAAFSGQRRAFIASLLCALGATAIELLKPWPTKVLFDSVLLSADDQQPWLGLAPIPAAALLGLSLVALSLIGGLLAMRSAILTAEIARKVTVRIRQQLFEHLHRLDMPFHTSSKSGDLIVRLIGDVNLARDALVGSWLAFADSGALMVGLVVVLFVLDPVLALCALAPLPLLAIHLGRSARELRATTRKQRRREGSAVAFATESLRQLRVVKAYSRERDAAAEFGRMTGKGEKAGLRAARITAQIALMGDLMSGLGLGLVLVVGTSKVISGSLTPGELLVVTSYSRTMFRPLRRVSREGGRLSKATTGTERVLEVMRLEPEISGGSREARNIRGAITFSGVRCSYNGEVDALDGLSFEIPAGSRVVVEGANGSGKSSMLAVLLRLTPIDAGSVLLDGVPHDDYELGSYRSAFAYVPQEIHLFAVSVRENIRYGRPDASDEEVEQAARTASFDEVVSVLSDGYETVIGESGATLSGGQARRLMLARAVLRHSPVLVLDEPLAGLDVAAREQVADSVRRISEGRTTIIVNHGGSEIFDPDIELGLTRGRVDRQIVHWRAASPQTLWS